MRPLSIALAGVVALAAGANEILAATFSSSALSSYTAPVLSGEVTATFGISEVPPPLGGTLTGPFTFGTGAGANSFFNAVGAGIQTTSASGSATSPPNSGAFAGAETHDQIQLNNNNGGSTSASLTFTYSYSAGSTVAAAVGDEAGAAFNFHITGADDEIGELLEVDTGSGFVAVSDYEIDMLQLASLGDTGTSVGPTAITVRYTGATPGGGADGVYAFSMFTRASGFALSPAAAVPEPSTIGIWLLIGLCLSCAVYRGRLRAKSAR